MDFTIKTSRLLLREFLPNDDEALFALNSDPEVLKYTGDKAFISVREAREFIEGYSAYTQYGYGRWAVTLPDTGLFLGWCGLKYHEQGFTDLGFRLMRDYWGKGYATEAAQASLAHAFGPLGLQEVIGRAARENQKSVRILEKLRMRFWKEAPCEGIAGAVYYRISAGEFLKSESG